jgi:hypothetical protein
MEGRTTICYGDHVLRTTFVYDDRAVGVLGTAAARASVPEKVLQSVANAEEIRLSAPNAGVVSEHRFPTRGLKPELARVTAACAQSGGQRSYR